MPHIKFPQIFRQQRLFLIVVQREIYLGVGQRVGVKQHQTGKTVGPHLQVGTPDVRGIENQLIVFGNLEVAIPRQKKLGQQKFMLLASPAFAEHANGPCFRAAARTERHFESFFQPKEVTLGHAQINRH